MIYGRKSERFVAQVPADQLQLTFSQDENIDVPQSQEKQQISYARQKPEKKQHPVRQELPAHLPRKVIDLYPHGCNPSIETFGRPEVTEILEYEPGKLHVIRYQRHKIKTTDAEGNERIEIAELPDRVIDKGFAGPGLMSQIISDKFLDHLPLYRQSQRYWREEKVHLPRSTLTDCVRQCSTALEVLCEGLRKKVSRSKYLQVDESGIRVLTKSKEKSTVSGCMQVYHAVHERLVWFRYTQTKEQANLIDILKSFEGNLQVDGNVSYEELKKEKDGIKRYPAITVSHCMAHARRKFESALDNDKDRATHVLTEIRKLYEMERVIVEERLDRTMTEVIRTEHSAPVLKDLKIWMDKEVERALPKSKIGMALRYTLKRWTGLCEFVNNGDLLIDNNLVENQIRPLALGRKNYLFAGSHDGARRAALFYSLFGTAKVNGINPSQWLRDVLIRIKSHPVNRIEELLPTANYKFMHQEEGT